MATRIMLVDDDPLVSSTIEDALSEAGYDVTVYSDPEVALSAMGGADIDILITDLVMPKLGGVDLIRRMRVLRPGLKVLAISGGRPKNGLRQLEIVGKSGATKTLAKPFSTAKLLAAVRDMEQAPK